MNVTVRADGVGAHSPGLQVIAEIKILPFLLLLLKQDNTTDGYITRTHKALFCIEQSLSVLTAL